MKLTVEENRERIKRFGHIRPAPMWGSVRCSVRCPGSSRDCTREVGHSGPHVAHGRFNRVLAVWDGGIKGRRSGARKSVEKANRALGVATRKGMGGSGLLASVKGLWGRVRRGAPSMEGALLIVLGLGMVWFAIETALRILGWRS
jgi:hypothetical protein